jgi:hypothetical protein
MKKIILSFALLCAVSVVSFAQTTRKSAEQTPTTQTDDTPMSDEAREKLRDIKKRGAEQKEEIMNDQSLNEEQRKTKLRQLKKEQEKLREEVVGKNKAGEIRGNRKDYRTKHPNGKKKPQRPNNGQRPEKEIKKDEEGQPRR